jgi:hypothetical protein
VPILDLMDVLTQPAAPPHLPAGMTRAAFCMGRQRIFADVVTAERRLLDVLRDPSRSYLDVRNGQLAGPDGQPGLREYGAGLVTKADIEWVTILAEPARVEERFFAHVKKAPVRVVFVLPSGEVEATVHVENAATDPVLFFLRGVEKGAERFLIATDATLPGATDPKGGVVIINRAAIQFFCAVR